MSSPRNSIPLDQAWAVVDAMLSPIDAPARTLPVAEAVGRVLRAEQLARLDLPPFDKSAMDGYAICPNDERQEYRLLGTVAAGQTADEPLAPGCAVKVMTGAPVPAGSGQVVMREYTEESGSTVRVLRPGGASNICRHGEDTRIGDLVLPAGRVITAPDAANLISCGIVEVPVAAPLRIAIISTGDEIVDDPGKIVPGKIMNANGPMLAALSAQRHMEVVGQAGAPDDLAATVAVLRESLEAADIVAISGGVSVGDFDYVLAAMDEVGLKVHFNSLAVKPGRPTVFATPGGREPSNKAVLGLPGNPVSVFVMFHAFVLRAAARLLGSNWRLRQIRRELAGPISRRKADRLELMPAAMDDDGHVAPIECHGSAHLLALRQADGLLQVPVGVREMAAGDSVVYTPLRSLMP